MNKIKAVLWDVDGTIADTEIFGHRIAFNKAFKEYNLNCYWDESLYIELLKISGGLNRIKYFSDIRTFNIDQSLISKIYMKKQDYYRGLIEKNKIPLRNGVFRLVNELKLLNINQYIVTTSSLASILPLIKNQFEDKGVVFQGSITREDVDNLKPHPEAYLKAINLFNLDPSATIVIEDSLNGLISAKKSGLNVLITLSPWLANTPTDIIDKASYVCNSLGDEYYSTKIIKGPSNKKDYINTNYLNKLLIN